MSNDNNSDLLAIVLAFFAGGLIGSALATLLTPLSGRETRERIVETTLDTKEKTTEIAGQFGEIVSHSISAGTKAFQNKREQIKTEEIIEEQPTVITHEESTDTEDLDTEVLEPFAEKTTG